MSCNYLIANKLNSLFPRTLQVTCPYAVFLFEIVEVNQYPTTEEYDMKCKSEYYKYIWQADVT